MYILTYIKEGKEVEFESTTADKKESVKQFTKETGLKYSDIIGFRFGK